MILGREPIPFLRQSVTLLVLVGPHLCWGQGKSPPEENTWTTTPPGKAPEAPAESPRSPMEMQAPFGELTDPWSTNQPGDVETPSRSLSETTERGERSPDTYWDEYNEGPQRGEPPPFERDRRKDIRPLVANYSLWLGAGAGWTLPFGNLWGTCSAFDSLGRCASVTGVPTHNYVAQGPALELDIGARLARNYNLYGLWEHSWLGAGSATSAERGQPQHGDTDFFALGLRVSTDPEQLGFILDIAVGSRRMRAHWADGTELQMTEAPLETRIGIGADVRLSDSWSLSPMLALGLGSFGKVQWVYPDGTVQSATQPGDIALTHGWVGLQMAAHADIFGTK